MESKDLAVAMVLNLRQWGVTSLEDWDKVLLHLAQRCRCKKVENAGGIKVWVPQDNPVISTIVHNYLEILSFLICTGKAGLEDMRTFLLVAELLIKNKVLK